MLPWQAVVLAAAQAVLQPPQQQAVLQPEQPHVVSQPQHAEYQQLPTRPSGVALAAQREKPRLPSKCPGERAFALDLEASTYDQMYLQHRFAVWQWALASDVTFDCNNKTVAARLHALRNTSTQALMVGNGPPDARLTPECFDAFDEVIRFNDFSKDYGSRTTVHVVNAVVKDYSPDAWVVLSLECVAPFVTEEPRFCTPSAAARQVLCSSPAEIRILKEAGLLQPGDPNYDDDPSRGFIFGALFPHGLRLTGFTDDGAKAPGTVDEGADHLLDAHHITEEHYVLHRNHIG
jgi:hypothetical protein